MPDRSPSPMAVSNRGGSPMSTTPPNEPHPPYDPERMIALVSALINGNVEAATLMFISFYHFSPLEALSALEHLISGNQQSQRVLSLLMMHLFATRPADAVSIFRGLGGSRLRAM
jgi:hypothetical protein